MMMPLDLPRALILAGFIFFTLCLNSAVAATGCGGLLGSGQAIVPNEFQGHLYAPVLPKKPGILISVGGFRTLERSVQGQFSHTEQVDSDPAVAAFA
jgi:hypothetical protein